MYSKNFAIHINGKDIAGTILCVLALSFVLDVTGDPCDLKAFAVLFILKHTCKFNLKGQVVEVATPD